MQATQADFVLWENEADHDEFSLTQSQVDDLSAAWRLHGRGADGRGLP